MPMNRDELIERGLRLSECPAGYDSCSDAFYYPHIFADGYADQKLGIADIEKYPYFTMAQGGAYRLGVFEAETEDA